MSIEFKRTNYERGAIESLQAAIDYLQNIDYKLVTFQDHNALSRGHGSL